MDSEADSAFATHHNTTRRDVFLADMGMVVPWADLCAVIEPFYPKPGAKGGLRSIGFESMLRIHFLKQWYALSDPAVEEALYESHRDAALCRYQYGQLSVIASG